MHLLVNNHTKLTVNERCLPVFSIPGSCIPASTHMPTTCCRRFRPEAEHSANAGLHIARELLEPIKKKYPWISYSDLWTLAGCVAVEELGGELITHIKPCFLI